MVQEKNKKINNIFTIITVLLYLVSISIYELLFCNSELMKNVLKGTRRRISIQFFII